MTFHSRRRIHLLYLTIIALHCLTHIPSLPFRSFVRSLDIQHVPIPVQQHELLPRRRLRYVRTRGLGQYRCYWWFSAFNLNSLFCITLWTGMNEVYVTGPSRKSEGANSDNIFYTRHVDGPWGLIPFVSVYRCIVGMDKNMMVNRALFNSLHYLHPIPSHPVPRSE